MTGTVTYLQRSALPPDATVAVTLSDVSRAGAPALVVGSQTIHTNGNQVPFAFCIPSDPTKIDASYTYAFPAQITDGSGQVLFLSTTACRVLTHENATTADIVVQPSRHRDG